MSATNNHTLKEKSFGQETQIVAVQNDDQKESPVIIKFFKAWMIRNILGFGLIMLAIMIVYVVLEISVRGGFGIKPAQKILFIIGIPGYFVAFYYLHKSIIKRHIYPQLNIKYKVEVDFLKGYVVDRVVSYICAVIGNALIDVWATLMILDGTSPFSAKITAWIVISFCSLFVFFSCYKWSINKFIIPQLKG